MTATQLPSTTFADARSGALHVRILPLALMAVLMVTAVPTALRAPVSPELHFDPLDAVLNVLLYVPLGVALARRIAIAFAAACALSGSAEVLQMFYVGRDPSFADFAANVSGAVLGALVARRGLGRFGSALGPEAASLRSGVVTVPRRAAAAGAFLISLILIALFTVRVHPVDLSNWDSSYPLLLGNEVGDQRPWRGEILALGILEGGIDGADARRYAALRHGDVPAALAASGALLIVEPLRLEGGSAVRVEPKLADRVFDEALAAGGFTVLLWASTASLAQEGPARLVSFSADTEHRNFDVGQSARSIWFRVRTPVTGLNGMNGYAATPALLEEGRPFTVAASFDGAVAHLYVDGRRRAHVNLAAQGCLIPSVCDVSMPAAAALLGAMLAALITTALPRFRTASVLLASLATGAALAYATTAADPTPHLRPLFSILVGAGASIWLLATRRRCRSFDFD